MIAPATRPAALLAVLLAGAAAAGPGGYEDEVHPRSPGTPLAIAFAPCACTGCEAEAPPLQMMRMPVFRLARTLRLEEGGWIALESPHFRLLSTLLGAKVRIKESRFARADLERLKTVFPKLAIGSEGATLTAHERAHLYAIRAERLYAHFAALTACESPHLGMEGPYEILLLERLADLDAFNAAFVGRASDVVGAQGLRHHERAAPNFLVFAAAEEEVAAAAGKGDHVFWNHVAHNVSHNLVDGHGNLARETWAWLEEGLAHYYTRRENERYNVFCWAEGQPPASVLKPGWEALVFDLVRRGKDEPLAAWCEKLQPGQLDGNESAVSWSIAKWLVETEPVRLTAMLGKLEDRKAKPSCADCIEFAFGAGPMVLHRRWRDYVLEHYAPR